MCSVGQNTMHCQLTHYVKMEEKRIKKQVDTKTIYETVYDPRAYVIEARTHSPYRARIH